jgi:putative FmdB family regulatory protein
MPTYEYRCRKCGATFERFMTFAEHDKSGRPACPKCRSRSTEKRPSAFQAVTAKKT